MTILPLDAGGLAGVAATLRSGQAVVLPLPTPLPYVVAATGAAAVNVAKGRPPEQPCGVLLGEVEAVAPYLGLAPAAAALALWISRVEQANLFVPLRRDAPAWLRSAAVDGLVGITSAWPARARPLAREFGHLFVSSANPTGGPAAVTATAADGAFGGRLLVLDGDPFRDAGVEHGSATIVEVGPADALRVARAGIHDRPFRDSAAYLEDLRRRFRSRAVDPRSPGAAEALRDRPG